jgi:hypothetical protein
MGRVNLEEERKRCREFYKSQDFIQRIVELYVDGVSWKGCKIIVLNEAEKKHPLNVEIDDKSLKDGIRNMLVDGIGEYKIKVGNSELTASIPMPPDNLIDILVGRSFLWASARDDENLRKWTELLRSSSNARSSPNAIAMLKILFENASSVLGVSYQFLLPNISSANAYIIQAGLVTFYVHISEWRKYLAFQIRTAVEPKISQLTNDKCTIQFKWNEDWSPQNGENGQVYQVFKGQGIELKTLREETLNAAKLRLENSLISRETYNEMVKWFL